MYIRHIKKQVMRLLKLTHLWLSICVFLLMSTTWSSCGQDEPPVTMIPDQPVDPVVEVEDDDFLGTMRGLTSMELVAEMRVGWNLGNSFDVRDNDKTAWGNPLSSSTHVRAVKAMGFETLRIPITWNFNQAQTAPYMIEAAYLSRIQLIVDEGLKNDMHVIINTHHDDWIVPTESEADRVSDRLASIWTQVSNHFSAYGDKLIFEVMNEPRLHNSPEEWSGGTQEGRDVVNRYQKVSVDAIRATGGNNSTRHLMIPTYAASTTSSAMEDLVVPNDDPNIIISLHSYFPWSFAGQEDGTNIWGSDEEQAALENELDWIRDRWVVRENRAVILGEWGTTDKNNLTARTEYCAFYAKEAVERGLLPIIWDDGGNFGMYNRNTDSWKYPEIAEAVVAAAK